MLTSIRLLVADDHEVVRAGIRAVARGTEINVVGEAIDGQTALELMTQLQPDVALLDVRMPVMDGLECLSRCAEQSLLVPVVFFSGYDNPTYIARAQALGAAGYLLKSDSSDDLLDAIRRVAHGESLWTSGTARRLVSALLAPRLEDVDVPLTMRENEVLTRVALGLTNKEIAQALDISYETAKEHVQHILKKIGVADRTQAAVWAVRHGLA
jgi:DNA-binding NarL/FixJ family response regulator